ncbi:unnamed protein product [Diamesa hyperborea]
MALKGVKTIVVAVLLMCIAKVTANQGNPCAGILLGYKNDFTDCRSYFKCVDEMEYPEQCILDGQYFDEERQKCVFAGDTVCRSCPETGYLIYRRSDSCSEFTMCENGVASNYRCPPGSYFHEYIRACFSSKKVVCHICPSTGVVAVHDRSDCRKYNICNNGEIVGQFDCSDDQFFDRNTRSCVEAKSCPLAATKPSI